MTGDDIKIANRRGGALRALLIVLLSAVALPACSDEKPKAKSPWTRFVQVAGQPDPVPEQWVSTPEGRFAHSIVVPNPVSKDSGYRPGMSGKEYFEHLCRTEAGEFIYKRVEGVKGFYFMRPPNWPTDDDLKNRYTLEAPEIERTFQLVGPKLTDRSKTFVSPPWHLFEYMEEPNHEKNDRGAYVRFSGYEFRKSPMQVEYTVKLRSRFALTWRGIKREQDREHGIAGSAWIVVDLHSNEVLALRRNFALTGFTRNAPGGIWWLNAVRCPQLRTPDITSVRFYEFVTRSLTPPRQDAR